MPDGLDFSRLKPLDAGPPASEGLDFSKLKPLDVPKVPATDDSGDEAYQAALKDYASQSHEAGDAAARGIVRGVPEAAAGWAGAGAGAEAGAALGSFGGPAGTVIGGLVGGGVGAVGGSWLAGKAEEMIFSHLPRSVLEAIGQLPEQQQADVKNHAVATMIGELGPNILAASPVALDRAAVEGAGIISRLVSATTMGGIEAGQELAQGESVDPAKVMVAAGAGAILHNPTAIGRGLTEVGAAPVRSIMGRAGPAAIAPAIEPTAEPTTAPKTATTEPTAEPTTTATPAKEVPPPAEAPAVGDIVGVKDIPGRLTVANYSDDGLVRLTDDDGMTHLMPIGDFDKYRTEPPPEEGAIPPVPAQGIEPVEPQVEASVPPPDLPPVAPGYTRMYSSAATEANGDRWATPDYAYARDFGAGDRDVDYVDVPTDHPALIDASGASPEEHAQMGTAPTISNSILPPDIAAGFKPTDIRSEDVNDIFPEPAPSPPPKPIEPLPPTPEDQAAAQARSQLLAAAGVPTSPAEATLAARIPADQTAAPPPPTQPQIPPEPAPTLPPAPAPAPITAAEGFPQLAQALGIPSASAEGFPQLAQFLRYPLREGEAPAQGEPAFQDLRDQFATALQAQPGDPHGAASSWLRMMGDASGNEHLVALDENGDPSHAYTMGQPRAVDITPDLAERLSGDTGDAVIHHNHPGGNALSGSDLNTLTRFPGVDTIVAHTPDGGMTAARLTPELRMMDPEESGAELANARDDAADVVNDRLQRMVDRQTITPDAASHAYNDLINRSLQAAGLIDYTTTQRQPLIAPLIRSVVREAAQGIRQDHVSDEDFNALVNRSPNTVQPDEILGGLPRRDVEATPGTGGGERGGESPESVARTSQAISAAEAPVIGHSLAEEGPPDVSDRATESAIEDAASKTNDDPSGRSFVRQLEGQLGSLPRSPADAYHKFNFLNRDFTMPRVKAALDQLSNTKWMAELAKKRLASTYLTQSREGFSSWNGAPAEMRNKVLSAMELLTLQRRTVPTDGRAIIAENTSHPLAVGSKIGDLIRLESPEEIKMFLDAKAARDQAFQNMLGAVAERAGWAGEPNAKAISDYAQTVTGGQARTLQQAAKIVAALEDQHRNTYLPFMRSGDYYFRVTPKEGTPDKPGILGWNAEGFPPTTLFKMIESEGWLKRSMGGQRSGIPPRATEELANLQKQFPPDEYNIDHGFMFRNPEGIRDLPIPPVEKLMMLVGNSIREQFAERMGEDEGSAAFKRTIDDVLNQATQGMAPEARRQIYQERLGSFRRPDQAIPGYDAELGRSLGRYLHWLASYTADIPYREQIDLANEALQNHPDPRTRQFWRDWDRRHEDFGDQFGGPLAVLRQASFYKLLGMNAASTFKIMLHGPLLGVPTLSTGLGAEGHMRAIGDYLTEAGKLLAASRIGKNGFEIPDIAAGVSDPRLRALLKSAEEEGITHPQGADEMRHIARGGEQALSEPQRNARRFLDIWSSNISWGDRWVRSAMLRAAYRVAQREGIDKISQIWDRDLNWANEPDKSPETFAKMMVDRTAGIWGDINRMPFFRTQIGGMMGQYRVYEMNYLSTVNQMLQHMGPEGKRTAAFMMLSLGSLGGAAALPFAQDAVGALNTAWGWWTKLQPDLAADSKNFVNHMMHHLGIWEDAGNDILHGPRPFGVDLGSGIGFGDLVSRDLSSPLDFTGAAVSDISRSVSLAKSSYDTGQGPIAVTRELLPNAFKHLLDGLYPEAGLTSGSGSVKLGSAADMSARDRIEKALGFQLAKQAKKFESFKEKMNAIDAQKAALTTAERRFANLQDRGVDTASAEKDIEDLITRGVNLGIYGNAKAETAQVIRALKAMGQQRANPATQSKTMQRMENVRP